MSSRRYSVDSVAMARAGRSTTSQWMGDNTQSQDFVPFARQQYLLINLLDDFKRVMEPRDDEFVDQLITSCALHVEDRGEVCDPLCTNRDRVYRLWDRLKRVPPSKFFDIVVPLLQTMYPHLVSLAMPEDKDLPEMCLRDVVLNVLHFDDIADDLLKNKIIKIIDHGDTKHKGPLTMKWAHLLNILKQKARSSKCEKLSEIFAKHLIKYEISVPPDLSYQLSCGLPCTCSDEVDGNYHSKLGGLRCLLSCFMPTGHKKSTERTPGRRQQKQQEKCDIPDGLRRSLASEGLTTSRARVPNGGTLPSSSSFSSLFATVKSADRFYWGQPSRVQEPCEYVVDDYSTPALPAERYRGLMVSNNSFLSTTDVSEREFEPRSRTVSVSSHFSGSSAVFGTNRTSLRARNFFFPSTSDVSKRDFEPRSRTMSVSSHFSGSSAVFGTERTSLRARNSFPSTSYVSERGFEPQSRPMSDSSHFSGSSAAFGTERTSLRARNSFPSTSYVSERGFEPQSRPMSDNIYFSGSSAAFGTESVMYCNVCPARNGSLYSHALVQHAPTRLITTHSYIETLV